MLVKMYEGDSGKHATAERRYSPATCTGSREQIITGNPDPDYISTSYIERQNLTVRMQLRRFTRLTNAFSKKLDNHNAAVALHYMHYNFTRIHQTLRVTPAGKPGSVITSGRSRKSSGCSKPRGNQIDPLRSSGPA
jgi:hypothetical protein